MKCKGCYLCVHACPEKTIGIDTKSNSQGVFPAVFSGGRCVACGNCYVVCPDICITVFEGAA
ncbi:MAG: 4Fe-4S dicluster domain-containing protein [Spirochaetaceae bacterium]|nr:4Fe-4S dicluster domain-containing protein [Spirochaetaceae bacterium]